MDKQAPNLPQEMLDAFISSAIARRKFLGPKGFNTLHLHHFLVGAISAFSAAGYAPPAWLSIAVTCGREEDVLTPRSEA